MSPRAVIAPIVLAALAGCGNPPPPDPAALSIAVAPPLEAFHRDFAPRFARYWAKRTRQQVSIAVLRAGDPATVTNDLYHAADPLDADVLVSNRQVGAEWPWRFPHGCAPFSSAVVFLVPAGNPKGVKGWDDLLRADVSVGLHDPASRWEWLAVAAAFSNRPPAEARDLVAAKLRQASSAPEVRLAWESGAQRAAMAPDSALAVVYPSPTLLIEPPALFLDRQVDQRDTRNIAQAYLEYLFGRTGQDLAARHLFHPRLPPKNPDGRERLLPHQARSIAEAFGTWDAARAAHEEEPLIDTNPH